jgi:HSP20 family protein
MAEKKQERTEGAESRRSTGASMERAGEHEIGRYGGTMSPFGFVRRMMEDMDRMFGTLGVRDLAPFEESFAPRELTTQIWSPEVEVFQRGDNLVVRADLPGLDEKDIKVNVDENGLTVSGERRHEKEWESEGVYQSERSYGSFERRIPLPRGIDASACDASFENGVLEVTIKLPKEVGRSVQIRRKKEAQQQLEAEKKPAEAAAPIGTTAEPQVQPTPEQTVQRH